MGTDINLKIGKVSVSYSKNFIGIEFGHLFQEKDLTRRKSDQIDYDYYRQHPDDIDDLEIAELAYVSTLRCILPRLRFSCSIESAREEYERLCQDDLTYSEAGQSFLTFDEFIELACAYPLDTLSDEYNESLGSWNEFSKKQRVRARFIKHQEQFLKIPISHYNSTGGSSYYLTTSDCSYFESKICILSPESMLIIFSQNPDFLDLEVVWDIGPLISNGYAKLEDFSTKVLEPYQTLLLTEGSSDTRILKRAFEVLRPDVSKFFRYNDLNGDFDYWGTGKLFNFLRSLQASSIYTPMIVILDNDAAGKLGYVNIMKLKLPEYVKVMCLPDLQEFKDIPVHKDGVIENSNINGHAASIECYLDLALPDSKLFKINHKCMIDTLKIWHGALETKGAYTKHFFNTSDESLKNGSYNTDKLHKLLNAIIEKAQLPNGHI